MFLLYFRIKANDGTIFKNAEPRRWVESLEGNKILNAPLLFPISPLAIAGSHKIYFI